LLRQIALRRQPALVAAFANRDVDAMTNEAVRKSSMELVDASAQRIDAD
jgi:hypothetical protein